MNTYRKPRWWQLYIAYAVMLGLLFAQASLPVVVGWHKLMEVSITASMLGLMALWSKRNARAMNQEALRRAVTERARKQNVILTNVQLEYLVAQECHKEYLYDNH